MSKTIKFNLICDNNPVRTIEDLQENFSIEDVLKYYENGLLARWLEVRGYSEEVKKVNGINCSDTVGIISELIKIFGIENDNKKIEAGVHILQYLEERKELCEKYKKVGFKANDIINDYQAGYMEQVNSILENPKDVAKIKTSIAIMVADYRWALTLNHRELFWVLQRNNSILAIMCLLMNNDVRNYYLPIRTNIEDKSGEPIFDIDGDEDKADMYDAICKTIDAKNFITELGDNLHIFSGLTEGYWKDLETKHKKYMIIRIGDGDFVRGAGVQGGDLGMPDINYNFVIIEGIDYKSNSETRQLLYMEI